MLVNLKNGSGMCGLCSVFSPQDFRRKAKALRFRVSQNARSGSVNPKLDSSQFYTYTYPNTAYLIGLPIAYKYVAMGMSVCVSRYWSTNKGASL